jgi:dihydropteroate synthase
MNRDNPFPERRLYYLGEISEPPPWLPPNIYPTIMPILDSSRVGVFALRNPSSDEIRYLERVASESRGILSLFKAGNDDYCVYIGSQNEVCRREYGGPEGPALGCEDFASAVRRFSSKEFELKLRSGVLRLGERTIIMGILNVTPDSFSDGGRFLNFDAAIAHGEKMAEDGADIIDVGGESTRPGAESVPPEEEAKRVIPVIEHLARSLSIPISIDTCKADIARRALDAGAHMVNDISALRADGDMLKVVRDSGCPLVLMHMQGTPKVMQQNPHYDALIPEILTFLEERIHSVVQQGVELEQIIVDPGIGFGKTVDHNLEILRGLGQFRALGRPLLVGPSRKSTIGKVLDAEVYDRMEGSAAAVAVAIANGAHIVRVHDVKEMARVAKMTDAIVGKKWK